MVDKTLAIVLIIDTSKLHHINIALTPVYVWQSPLTDQILNVFIYYKCMCDG